MDVMAAASAVTGVTAALVILWRVTAWGGRIVEGLRCQLRTDMLRVYYGRREAQSIRRYELQDFEANYAAYRALGGNSFIGKVHDEVMKWKIVP